jgi:hypothetical protein
MFTYTVPAGASQVTLTTVGAAGGPGWDTVDRQGGAGATMSGTFFVNPGDVLTVFVGQKGSVSSADSRRGAGGGGGSAVVLNSSGVLLAAGGGGGGGRGGPGGGGLANLASAAAGGAGETGGLGGAGGGGFGFGGNPAGNGTTGGGAASLAALSSGGSGGNDSGIQGGNGGVGFGGGGGANSQGGGGGGGYRGGDGATDNQAALQGAGGDSFFDTTAGILGSATAGSNNAGEAQANSGNGLVTIVNDVYKTITVPPVVISALHHHYNDDPFFGFTQISDTVTFPSGPGTFSGPGFSASLAGGDTVVVRFSAPPGKQFVVRHIPEAMGGVFFLAHANWQTVPDFNGAPPVPNSVTFENLVGAAPANTHSFTAVSGNGQSLFAEQQFRASSEFSFTALRVEFRVPVEVAEALRTYGAVNAFGSPSFGARADVNGSFADQPVMTIEALPAPEIGVQQPAGTDLVAGAANVDFGTLDTGASAAKTFVITNSGNRDLTSLAITKSGAGAGHFSVSSLGATTLAPNESQTFTVTFSAPTSGQRSAVIHLASNDLDENPFAIQLTGAARPVANGQSVTVTRDTPKAITLTGAGFGGTQTNFVVATPPAHGALTGTAPHLTYTPGSGYVGPDSFTFSVNDGSVTSTVATVSISVLLVNAPPVADHQTVTVLEDTPTTLTLTGSDPDGPTPNFVVASLPSRGVLSGVAPMLTYNPALDYSGPDSFTFTVNDGSLTSAVATVSINITPVNDAPIALPQSLGTLQDTPLAITLTAADPDGPQTNFVIAAYPARGSLSGNPPEVTYTPAPDFSGLDSITFRANDGSLTSGLATVTITVTAVTRPPVANSASLTTAEDTPLAAALTGSDPAGRPIQFTLVGLPRHGTLTGWPPALTYTPAPNFSGTDSFRFLANNGTLRSTNAIVSISVTAVNDPPVAAPLAVTTVEDTPVNLSLVATDVDGPLTNFAMVLPPTRGSVTGNGATRTYTPTPNYYGVDSFTYTATDGSLTSAPVAVTINITQAIDPRQTIHIGPLVDQGLDFAPEGGYNVLGVNGWVDFRLDDIRPVTNGMTGTVRWQANDGLAGIYGPGYTIESAYMQSGRLLLNGQLSFLPVFVVDEFGNRFSTDCSIYVDRDGNPSLAGGTICFPKKITIPRQNPKLTLEDVCLTINPATRTYGGSAKLGLGLGNAGNFCPGATVGPPLFGVNVLVREGRFDTLGLSVENLRKPLGNTGAFLDGLAGTVGNLSQGSDWFVQASMEINAGCPISIGSLNAYPLSVRADGRISGVGRIELNGGAYVFKIQVAGAWLRYSPPYNIGAGTWVNFQDILRADARFNVSSGPLFSGEVNGSLGIPRYVPIVGGWNFAQAYAAVNNDGFRGSFSINVTPEIPSVCSPRICPPRLCPGRPCWCCWCDWCWTPPCIPPICTPRIPAVSARVGFSFVRGSFSFSTKADSEVEAWELSYRQPVKDEATGNQIAFMNNWSRVDKASTGKHGRNFAKPDGDPVTGFTVPEGEEVQIFRLTYENTNATSVMMTLDTPTVTGLEVNAGPLPHGFTNLPGSFAGVDLERREAFFLVSKPASGAYTVRIANGPDLGNYAVEQLRQNPAPTVAILSVSPSGLPGVYLVRYSSLFREGSPVTRIYLTHASADFQHKSGATYLLSTTPTVNGTNEYFLDARALDLPPGRYHVAVNVDDPASLEVEAVSTTEVLVANPAAPLPVPRIAASAGHGSFTVTWDPSPDTNIVSYVVRYTAGDQPYDFESETNVDAVMSDLRTVTVTDLTNGQPYLVTVAAVNGGGYQSENGEVLRVVPTEGPGRTPPVIVSRPKLGATANATYLYVLQTFDGDDDLFRVPLRQPGPAQPDYPYPVDGNGLYWELVSSPPGMTMLPNGIILWTPTSGQVGEHLVLVRTTEMFSLLNPPVLSAEQSFVLTVLPEWNLSGAQPGFAFLSRPPAAAFEGETYTYTPQVLIGSEGWAITILDGPADMNLTMDTNGLDTIVWHVPPGAQGQRVRLRAAPRNAVVTPEEYVYQDYFLSVVSEDNQLPRSQAPVAGDDVLGTDAGRPVTLPLSRLLLNDQSVAGVPMDIIAVSDGAHGTVVIVGNNLTYTPAAGYTGPDSFTYTLSDGFSSVVGTVNVFVRGGPGLNLLSPTIVGSDLILRFGGIAGRTYVMQWSPVLNGSWTDLPGPVTIPPGANTSAYTHTNGLSQTGFYRTRQQ